MSFFVSIISGLKCLVCHLNVLKAGWYYQLPETPAINLFHALRQPYIVATVQAASTMIANVDALPAHKSIKAAN